jgi:hypothetical protein
MYGFGRQPSIDVRRGYACQTDCMTCSLYSDSSLVHGSLDEVDDQGPLAQAIGQHRRLPVVEHEQGPRRARSDLARERIDEGVLSPQDVERRSCDGRFGLDSLLRQLAAVGFGLYPDKLHSRSACDGRSWQEMIAAAPRASSPRAWSRAPSVGLRSVYCARGLSTSRERRLSTRTSRSQCTRCACSHWPLLPPGLAARGRARFACRWCCWSSRWRTPAVAVSPTLRSEGECCPHTFCTAWFSVS